MNIKLHDWSLWAKHDCGDVVLIPMNNIELLMDFRKICPKCGKRYENKHLHQFIGLLKLIGKWYNPFTWKIMVVGKD